jgi:hypothetical protein
MKKVTNHLSFIICANLMLSQATWAGNWNKSTTSVSEPIFSEYFYGDTVGEKSCVMTPTFFGTFTLKPVNVSLKLVSEVVGFDWAAEHARVGTSLSVNHEKISKPARELFALSQHAMQTADPQLKTQVKKLIVDIAEANTILNSPTLKDTRSKGGLCYGDGNDTKAICRFHTPLFAMQFGTNYLIASSLLKNDMTAKEQKVVEQYADKLYQNFSRPMFAHMNKQKSQFSQLANGGIAVLAHAYWKKDKKLAQQTFNLIFENIDRVFMPDGYIKGTSFRGVRGFWYHTYGTNSALAVIALADLWKTKPPPQVLDKVKKATALINVGIKDIKQFYSRPDPDGKQRNASYDEKDARHHVHQMAIGIAHLAKLAVGEVININADTEYKQKMPSEYPSDFTIGFNSNCMTAK